MLKTNAAERVSNVRRKIQMAHFHANQLVASKELWSQLGDSELEIRTAAHLEGCMHSLHHCLDILAHAVLFQHQPHVKIKGQVSFAKLLTSLAEVLAPEDPLLTSCLALWTDPEVEWLRAFVNYSKHHNLVRVVRLMIVGSDGQEPYLPDVFVHSFTYGGTEYPATFAIASAKAVLPVLNQRLEDVISSLS